MSKLLVLSSDDVSKAFTVTDALSAVEHAYGLKATGDAATWPMVYEQFEPDVSDMDIRSGDLAADGLFGLKLTSFFSGNAEKGLPVVQATALVCDDTNGTPVALVNAGALTGLRTGSAGALGIRWLARKDSSHLMVAGAGNQCPYQIAAALAACPNLDHVAVWSPISPLEEERLEQIRETVEGILAQADIHKDWELVGVSDPARSAGEADAIVTVTPATEPVIKDAWVKPGTHLSCVGADLPGKQEVESALVKRARAFADDIDQSISSGELEVPVKQGAITRDDIVGEIGQVIAGITPGRVDDNDITLFDTSGIAVQDLAAARVAVERALELGIGQTVEL
jgi:alanine dehydrogenase